MSPGAGRSRPLVVLGVRHHGPGSARSVRQALDRLQPSTVVIEGPPELDAVAHLAGGPAMVPPVAGLVYRLDQPRVAAFYPLARFSPEWVALRWALARSVTVRFADLPATNRFALADLLPGAPAPAHPDLVGPDPAHPEPVGPDPADSDRADVGPTGVEPTSTGTTGAPPDPIGALARAAGYDDAERWWEDAVEQRPGADDPLARFQAVTGAMAAFRADQADHADDLLMARREAAMRRVLREAVATATPSAPAVFVCGAYHAPAVDPRLWPSAAADNAVLRGLPRCRVGVTWAPWTLSRLAQASGYGAGVTSPGWYDHLFTVGDGSPDPASAGEPDQVVVTWMVRAAVHLREEGYDASPASAVEAARLAAALAALRGRPRAGLGEVTDALRSVLCHGSSLPLGLIHDRLVVGTGLGSVPVNTPGTPLAQDLAAQQKKLRLTPSAEPRTVNLDLRQEGHRARSVFLHRLGALAIGWGQPADAGRTRGTFKEAWRLAWQPEQAVEVIEASLHGTTVASAAEARVAAGAAGADLPGLAALVEVCLEAELPGALATVVRLLEERSAHQHDAEILLEAVEPLARIRRYGTVRGVDTVAVTAVLETLVTRAAVGLPLAAAALDDDRAAVLRGAVESAHRGLALLDAPDLRASWHTALSRLVTQRGVHGAVQGRVARLLLDGGQLDSGGAREHLGRALSVAADPAHGAAWVDGFLTGDALLLLHDRDLLALLDDWVSGVPSATFDDLLPLLRRSFARYDRASRRQLGQAVGRTGPAGPGSSDDDRPDTDRASAAVARVATLLGLVSGSIPSGERRP